MKVPLTVNTIRKPSTNTASNGRASTVTTTADLSALSTVTGSTGNDQNYKVPTTKLIESTGPTRLNTANVSSKILTIITTPAFSAESVTPLDTDVTNTSITTPATSAKTEATTINGNISVQSY